MTEHADRDALTQTILAARWLDGTSDGFPTRKVAQMIAEALLDDMTWLADHDRQVAAKTLRDAAAACRRMADQAEIDAGGKLDRWDAFTEAEDWMTTNADQIEGDA